MDRRAEVEQALRNGKTLPAGPAVMARIGDLCKDPKASARDLGKVLQLDPALTTRVLKQVNSSFYGLSATIKTVTHAVVILGFQEIKNVALSVPVANLYEDNFDAPGLNVSELWKKTLETACFARTLSYHIRYEVPEQVFVAGILANTGMVVLNGILGDDYAHVVESCPDEEFLPDVETAELGVSNVDVCRMLAEKWHFPDDLIRSITLHYAPIRGTTIEREAALICAARRLRRALSAGEMIEAALMSLPDELLAAFALTPDAVEKAYEKAQSEFEQAHNMLSRD